MPTPRSDILLVDDDPAAIQVLGRILSGLGRLRFATNGAGALRLAHETPPDLILLDAEMPGMSGFDVCEAMKSDPELADIPVIFVTSHNDQNSEIGGFDLGAADFIAKPISEPLVVARVKTQLRIKHLTDELRKLSTVDALTGLANRRRFDEMLEREWSRAQRPGYPLALAMIDVDHFKRYNDRYGHPAGDTVLRSVAQALAHAAQRPADLVARYGGEEFVMLMPQTPRAGAQILADRALVMVESLGIPHAGSPTADHVTVSIGMACWEGNAAHWEAEGCGASPRTAPAVSGQDLLTAADQALYAAKAAGRAQAWEARRIHEMECARLERTARAGAPR